MATIKPLAKKLKKENVLPGSIMQVRTDRALSNGLDWFDRGSGLGTDFNTKKKQTMTVMFPLVAGHKFDIHGKYSNVDYKPGDTLEVVVGPTKRAESHTVVVKDPVSGREGFVHWCEFSVCCVSSLGANNTAANTSASNPQSGTGNSNAVVSPPEQVTEQYPTPRRLKL